MNTALPFIQVQYIICNQDQWSIHFDRFFPADQPTNIGQNFRKCSYYVKWHELKCCLSKESVKQVRAILWSKFNTLAWVPYTQSDRMWTTCQNPGQDWKVLPADQPHVGPQVASHPNIHQRQLPLPHICPIPIINLEEEANEGEGEGEDEQDHNDHNQNREQMVAEIEQGQRNIRSLYEEEEESSDDDLYV